MTDLAAQPKSPVAGLSASKPSAGSIIAIALGLTFLARGPFATLSGPDDGFYSEVALLWRNGLLPYLHAFDVKPPGFFAVLALVQSLFGPSMTALRVVGWLSDAMTMALLLAFGWRRGVPGAGIIAAILYAWFSKAMVDDDCYSLLIAVTTLAMMVVLSDLAAVPKAIGAGLVIGAAGLVKQTAAFDGIALLVILLIDAPSVRIRLKSVFVFCVSALLPLLGMALYFAANGALAAAWADAVGIALQRPGASSDHISFLEGVAYFLCFSLYLAPVLLLSATMIILRTRLLRFQRETRALGIWLVIAIAAVLVQHAILGRYFGPMLPPALLLTGLAVALRLETRPADMRLVLIALGGTFLLASLARFATMKLEDMSGIDRVSAAIAAAASRPDDRLYVIGAGTKSTWTYVRTGLRPATPFIIPSQQACDFPNVGPARIDEAFAAQPRFVVTEREKKAYACEVDGVANKIANALARDYRLIATTDGNAERFNLYEIARPAVR